MIDFNKIDLYLKRIKNLNNNEFNYFKDYILKLNLTNEEKQQLLTKLFTYDIEKKNNNLFNKIINKHNLNQYISSLLEYNIYDQLIHKYLCYKILCNGLCKFYNIKIDNIINNPINNIKPELINKLIDNQQNKSDDYINQLKNDLNNKLKKELTHINEIIDENNLLKIISDKCFINYNINKNNDINPYNKLVINKLEKHNYTQSLKKYYFKDTLQSYQCYFKAAINFFLNNSEFISQIIEAPNNILSDLSVTVDSLKLKGGNYTEFYDLIKNMYEDDTNNKNIDNYYIKLKGYINEHLNDKYYLGIPGFKIYPYYVIQDILLMLKDNFCNDCIIEYKENYNGIKNSYILNCEENCFFSDILYILAFNIYSINDLKYDRLQQIIKESEGLDEYEDANTLCNSDINKINFIYKNNKYYYEDNICNYILQQNILKYPKNLLIACPIHDITGLLMLNKKICLSHLPFNDEIQNKDNESITSIISKIKKWYEVSIIYPFIINIDNNKYYLHSFINLVNNETITSHFAYYKVDFKNINLNDDNIDYSKIDLLKYDGTKFRINQNNLNKQPFFIKNEFNILRHNDYNSDFIKDNLSCKIVFCYYRKI